jgi:hypothetical protein
MAAPRRDGEYELPDENVKGGSAPTRPTASTGRASTGTSDVHEQNVAGTRVQVIEAEASDEKVAPSPGSDRTPGEPTESPGGSSDVVSITVTPEQAESMKLLLSQLSFSGGPAGIAALVEQQRRAMENDKTALDSNEAAYQGHQERLKEMNVTLQSSVTPEIAAREMRARDKLYAKTLRMDQSVPGGVYLASDGETYINANGDPIKGDPTKKEEASAS